MLIIHHQPSPPIITTRHVPSSRRCLGVALDVALELATQHTTTTGDTTEDNEDAPSPAGLDLHTLCHMCCIAGGPPTVGPGTPRGDGKDRQWYTALGTRAGLARCCVDVWMFNGGGDREHMGVVLGLLCARTGGVLQELTGSVWGVVHGCHSGVWPWCVVHVCGIH